MEYSFNVENKEIKLIVSIWTGKIIILVDGKENFSTMKLGFASTLGDVISFILGGTFVYLILQGI